MDYIYRDAFLFNNFDQIKYYTSVFLMNKIHKNSHYCLSLISFKYGNT